MKPEKRRRKPREAILYTQYIPILFFSQEGIFSDHRYDQIFQQDAQQGPLQNPGEKMEKQLKGDSGG